MQAALDEAAEASRAGEVPVGAVVVREDAIIVRAQNRMVRDGDATSHAELLAMREATRRTGDARLVGCTLVVTLEPCAMCAGAIVLARPDAVVFGAWDDKAGMCGSVGDIVRHPRLNHRPQLRGGVMADASTALLKQFFAERRP
ncbi:MAG: nucleoside deaminase [Gemmatimonadaceae bacterium]|nr:nucleoside deaminase [Gemmatimonadaceae bacterium]